MQLNGSSTISIMPSSEPPEPPPRNPDKINASLKQLSEMKSLKSIEANDKVINNNNNNNNNINNNNNKHIIKPTTAASITTATTPLLQQQQQQQQSQNQNDNNLQTDNNKQQSIEINNQNNGDIIRMASANVKTITPIINMDVDTIVNIAADEIVGSGDNEDLAINIKSPTSIAANNLEENKCKNDNNIMKETVINNCNNDDTIINSININNIKLLTHNDEDSSADEYDVHQQEKDTPIIIKLRDENVRLTMEIARLRKLLENSPEGAVGGSICLSDSNSTEGASIDGKCGNSVERLETELKMAKEQITNLKVERRKLRSDKNDLLMHVKQLCSSLQDKERELRDFIRNYEQRIRDSECSAVKLTTERERERWNLLKHVRDETERSLTLAAQLNARDIQLQRTQEQLQDARRQLSGCMSDQESIISIAPLTPPSGIAMHSASAGYSNLSATTIGGDRGSCSADSGVVRGSSDRDSAAGDPNLSDGTCDNGPCLISDQDNISLVSSHHLYQFTTSKEHSPSLSPLNSVSMSRGLDSGYINNASNDYRSAEQLSSPVDTDVVRRLQSHKTVANTSSSGRSMRGGTWGSISRVFSRSRNRTKNQQADSDSMDYQWSTLTEEGYAEKLRLLREASSMPMERWRAPQILAWLEVALGMSQYSVKCAENVKSGKVILELTDSELESGLGLTHPMHKKKIRLAIEEQRRPDLIRHPTIGQLGHTWVATEWLPDIGLSQYAESFLHSLVDARMLDSLSKKELEKFLGVTRKFHQASIVHGIHVLRLMKYDRQSLAIRRIQCENIDTDPIVWTNQRFARWLRSIDLAEYADNVKDSGLHGGLVVLEPSFCGDTMATALGIPPSKNIIRRHLSTEFDALVLPARTTLGQGIRSGGAVVPLTGPCGLQQSDRLRNSGSLRFTAWKGSQGSLSKAFRFYNKTKTDKPVGSSTSPTPSYSSSEGGIYATITGCGVGVGTSMLPPPTMPPPPPPSHRVSAPPMEQRHEISTLPRYSQHRRVKSISDIELVTSAPI